MHSVDLPHIRRLYDELLGGLSILQADQHEIAISGGKRKLNKSFCSFPCGFINVEEVASVALRPLRVNSSSSPKQVRADKKLYDDLIQNHLKDLHCLAWKVVSFLFKNLEMGTEGFEGELGILTRDQIKSDFKNTTTTGESVGKGSERALEQFSQLIRAPSSFNGQVFVNEIVRSGILVEVSTKSARSFCSLLRSGVSNDTINAAAASSTSSKRARYHHHQASESDQKRLETAQKGFASELSKAFLSLSQTLVVFESSHATLSPQDHILMTESILSAMAALLQSQHNFKFIPEICESEYMRLLINSLAYALVSFQPAYLPPFLPFALRVLGLIGGKIDACGLAARRALLQADLLIHPRRLGPVTFRAASEDIVKVFERPEPIGEIGLVPAAAIEVEVEKVAVVMANESASMGKPVPVVPIPAVSIPAVAIPVVPMSTVNIVTAPQPPAPQPIVSQPPAQSASKRTFTANDDDEDDLPLPQIVDSGPDDI